MYKKVIIVNKNDQIIDHKNFSEIDFPNEIYRTSGLWVEDIKGNILLQKRSDKVMFNKNKWSFAVAGVNDEDETYESNIIKEAREELDLDIKKPELLGKVFCPETERNTFRTYFRYKLTEEKPKINFDPVEVADVRWFSKEELNKMLDQDSSTLNSDISEMREKFGLL